MKLIFGVNVFVNCFHKMLEVVDETPKGRIIQFLLFDVSDLF